MNNSLQIFSNEEFGNIRAVEIDGEAWLVGKDVADALGYSNPNEAISDHIDSEDKLNSKMLSSFEFGDNLSSSLGQRGGWLINESGFYSLVMSSKLKSAKRFKRWVTSEVLPSIRKTGGYGNKTMTQSEIISAIAADNVEKEKRLTKLENNFNDVMEVFVKLPEGTEWRRGVYQSVNNFCAKRNLNYLETWDKLYTQLEARAGCNLTTLLQNRRKRAMSAGETLTSVGKLNKLDCIAGDKRLREIFTAIVREFSAGNILASNGTSCTQNAVLY